MLNLLSIKISRFARNDKKRNYDTVSNCGESLTVQFKFDKNYSL